MADDLKDAMCQLLLIEPGGAAAEQRVFTSVLTGVSCF